MSPRTSPRTKARAIKRALPAIGEIIATVSSKSVGPGTRKNIDEFTRTTAGAVEKIGGAAEGKAIIVINPAEPPLIMRDTIHCLTEDEPDEEAITRSIHAMVASRVGEGASPCSSSRASARRSISRSSSIRASSSAETSARGSGTGVRRVGGGAPGSAGRVASHCAARMPW